MSPPLSVDCGSAHHRLKSGGLLINCTHCRFRFCGKRGVRAREEQLCLSMNNHGRPGDLSPKLIQSLRQMACFSFMLVLPPKNKSKRDSEGKEQESVEEHFYLRLHQFFREGAALHASMHDDVNHTCYQADDQSKNNFAITADHLRISLRHSWRERERNEPF